MSPPLILAIQPDKRQASQLTSIVRGMSAELLLMESTERAMAALGERLPDLILTPALLSQRDENLLAERLREFGDAAAHIQTLTIPILETAPAPERGGVLSALRKPKRTGRLRPDERLGCTADTFAEQVSIYLNRAVEARSRPKPRTRVPAATTAPTLQAPQGELPHPDAVGVPPQADRLEKSYGLPTLEELSTEPPEVPAQTKLPKADSDIPPKTDRLEKSDGLPTIEELSAKTPAVPEPDGSLETSMEVVSVMTPMAGVVVDHPVPVPEAVPRVAALPIELSSSEATTPAEDPPAVPEPSGSVESSMEAIAAMAPVAGALADHPIPALEAVPPRVAELPIELSSSDTATPADEAPAVPEPHGLVESGMEVITVMASVADAVVDYAVRMPEVMPRVAELSMEVPPQATSAADDAPAVPEPDSSLDVSMTAVVDVAPDADAGADLALMPAMTPRVAELPMELLSGAASVVKVVPVMPEPRGSLGMSMASVAVSVPDVDAGTGSIQVPEVMPRVAELRMELPTAAASAGEAVPVMPEPYSLSMASITVVVPEAGDGMSDTVPMPEVVPRVADLPMELSSADISMPSHDVTLVVPAPPSRSIDTSIQMAAAMASGVGAATNGQPVSLPPVVARVAEIRVDLPGELSGSVQGTVPFVPTPPAGAVEMSMGALRAIVPLTSGAGHHRPAPIPAVMAPIAELPVELSSTEAAAFAVGGTAAVPEPPRSVETDIDSLAAMMPAPGTDDRRPAPMPPGIPHIVERPVALTPERAPVPQAPATALGDHAPIVGAQGAPTDTSIEAATAAALPEAPPAADEPPAPAGPAAARHISKASKKKNRLQSRKAARKKGPVRDDVLDDPFDPEQCRFSALIAKLDEVVCETGQTESSDRTTHRGTPRKGKKKLTKPN